MKTTLFRRDTHWRNLMLLIVVVFTVIISCRKDHNKNAGVTQNDVDVTSLQSNYNAGINLNARLQTGALGLPQLNLIHSLNVDWSSHKLISRTDGSTIIEFNVKDTSRTFMQNLQPGQLIKYHDKTTVVFVLKHDSIATSFFMKVIEDLRANGASSTITKLHYGNIPSGFNGTICYFTLDRTFMNGYRYKNGKITADLSVVIPVNNPGQQVQSIGAHPNVVAAPDCTETDYYQEYCEWGGTPDDPYEYFHGCEDTYIGSTIECDDTSGGGGDGGGAASDPSGGGGGNPAPAPPPPCSPPSTIEEEISGGRIVIFVVAGGGGTGSGTGSGTPCPTKPQTPPDPCAAAKAIKANAAYNSKLSDLNGYTTSNLEHGWFDTQNADGSYSYKSENSTPADPGNINFSFNTPMSDMLHNHFTGQNTTFDEGDIYAMAVVFNASKMANPNTFTSTVVTPSGTYMLSINNLATFTTFAANANETTIDAGLELYGYYTSNGTPEPNATQESALTRFLSTGNTGLTVLKLDANGNFSSLSYDSTTKQVTTTNCNN